MTFATLTAQDRINIPARVRAAPGVGASDRVAFVQVTASRLEVIAASAFPVTRLRVVSAPSAESVRVEAMNAAVWGRADKALSL